MPPRSKAAPKAKAIAKKAAAKKAAGKKAAAPAKPASASAPAKSPQPSVSLMAAPSSKPPAKKAHTTAIAEAVTRLLRLKFSHVATTFLATAVNADGETLDDVIGNEVRRTTLSGEYIKAGFWSKLESDFGLQSSDWEQLAEPEAAIAELDPYDSDLPTIMRLVLGDNPAMKSKGLDRLEVHLECCDRLPLRQVYGMLLESCESSRLSKAHSHRFQWMLLRYVAKHEVFDVSNNVFGSHDISSVKRFVPNT
jgi:hypothetical protein